MMTDVAKQKSEPLLSSGGEAKRGANSYDSLPGTEHLVLLHEEGWGSAKARGSVDKSR